MKKIRNPDFSKNSVREYFNKSQVLFSKWNTEHVHYGIWDLNTRNLEEATLNTSKFVAECLDIKSGDVILDAGCGVGGTSRYIVSTFGVKTVGITISDKQIRRAKELSRNVKNSKLLEFHRQDFTHTTFADESFTKILALESMVYAPDKRLFLNEIYRLLKKGGKFAVLDGFQTKVDLSSREKAILLKFLQGWEMAEFTGMQAFYDLLSQTGFQNIIFHDKKEEVKKTILLVYKKAKKLHPFTWLFSKLRIIPKEWHTTMVAGVNQKKCLDYNLGTYGVFIADK